MAVTNISDQEFEKILKSNSKVVVKYYADWCGSCKLFSPKFKRLSEDERFKDVKFIEVNAETNEEARKAASVDNLPFIATFKEAKFSAGSATSKEEYVIKMLDALHA